MHGHSFNYMPTIAFVWIIRAFVNHDAIVFKYFIVTKHHCIAYIQCDIYKKHMF